MSVLSPWPDQHDNNKQTKEPEEKKEGATGSAVVGYFFYQFSIFQNFFFHLQNMFPGCLGILRKADRQAGKRYSDSAE